MTSAFGDLSGSGNQQIWLNFWYIGFSGDGNYSVWGWECRYYGNGWGTWGATLSWGLSGFAGWNAQRYIGQSERYDPYTVLGGGTFTRQHDANGYLAAGLLTASLSSDHSSIGSGSVSVFSGTPPHIPKATVPPAPRMTGFGPNPDQITATTMRVRFAGQGDGGSPITSWALQGATDPAFNNVVFTIPSSGTTHVTGLRPGTTYYYRARGQNAVGVSPWSPDPVSARTLSAAYVGKGGAFPPAEAVNVAKGSAFPMGEVFVGKGGSFVTPL